MSTPSNAEHPARMLGRVEAAYAAIETIRDQLFWMTLHNRVAQDSEAYSRIVRAYSDLSNGSIHLVNAKRELEKAVADHTEAKCEAAIREGVM